MVCRSGARLAIRSRTIALAGKTARITGGSCGIGAAWARLLGDGRPRVAITSSSSADQAKQVVADIAATGGSAFALPADAGGTEAATAKLAQAAEKPGQCALEILANDAGGADHGRSARWTTRRWNG